MILIICLWALLMFETARFVVSTRNAVRAAGSKTVDPLAKKAASIAVITLIAPVYIFTIGVLVAAIVALSNR